MSHVELRLFPNPAPMPNLSQYMIVDRKKVANDVLSFCEIAHMAGVGMGVFPTHAKACEAIERSFADIKDQLEIWRVTVVRVEALRERKD